MQPRSASERDADRRLFTKTSVLEIVVPHASQFDVGTYLEQDATAQLSSVKQRDVLLFEELLTVYLVLRTAVSKDAITTLLPQLEVTASAHANSAAPPPTRQNSAGFLDTPPARVLLDSKIISADKVPSIVQHSEPGSSVYITWKASLRLRHPEQPLQRPAVHFSASAVLHAVAENFVTDTDDEWLSSGIPAPENLFQPLQNSPAFLGTSVSLPVSRIVKQRPRSAVANAELRPLRAATRLFIIVPALAVKIHRSTVTDRTMVILDVEVARWVERGIVIEAIKAFESTSELQPLQASQMAALPQNMKMGDRSTYLFALADGNNTSKEALPNAPAHNVHFRISGTAHLGEECKPNLQIQWEGNLRPASTGTGARTISHWQRPAKPTSSPAQDVPTARPVSKLIGQALRPPSISTPDQGITFAITGPAHVIEGDTFHLDVFVVNRSLKKRRLAIVAIPITRKASTGIQIQDQRWSRAVQMTLTDKAQAVVSNHRIYEAQHGLGDHHAEIVTLNADVKIGPLPPGACHSTQLEFLTLSSGTVGLASVSVVDLDSRETVQIIELPDVLVTEKSPKAGEPLSAFSSPKAVRIG